MVSFPINLFRNLILWCGRLVRTGGQSARPTERVTYSLIVAFILASLVACVAPTPTLIVPTVVPKATNTVAAPTSTPTPTETPAPTSTPIPVTFVFGSPSDPVCLDPAVITDTISARVTNQIFEGLVKYDRETTNVVPGLAEKWSVSDDGKVWTFTLRQGVRYHDGTEFNADAVVRNFDYWKNSRNAWHSAQVKAGQTFDYFEAQFGGFDGQSIITKFETIDNATVRVILREPQGAFLNNLAMFVFGMWSPTALNRAGANVCAMPVGTGPYKFVEWRRNEQVTLEAFVKYWDQPNAARTPRVIIRTIPDEAARLQALVSGEIQGAEVVDTSQIATVQFDNRYKLVLRPSNVTAYLAFNFKIKEFQDARVRQAFAMAFDKAALVTKAFAGTGLVAKEFQPPALWGYNREIDDWKYDATAAKKFLADAGFPNGISEVTLDGKKVPLELWYPPIARPYLPNPKDTATTIATDWAKAGIHAQTQTMNWATYLERRSAGQLPLYILGWSSDNGDPDNMLCYFFCMDDKDTPIAREGFFADKLISDTLKRGSVTTDPSTRVKLYQQVEKLIHDRVLRVFIAHNQTPLVLLANVEGYAPHPLAAEYWNTLVVK
ncbi:MAG: ABC transporter substrate-binding protein [Chloroflexi bacterium]|nr:ABC transporter substrate-binding protein [Chloroflexota bacterium]